MDEKIDEVLDKWWAGHVQNSPVSRNTVVHNHLHDAFGKLREDLKAALGESTDDEVKDDDHV